MRGEEKRKLLEAAQKRRDNTWRLADDEKAMRTLPLIIKDPPPPAPPPPPNDVHDKLIPKRKE
jgi:hypothetical protein